MSYFKAVLKGHFVNGTETRNIFYFDSGNEGEQYMVEDIELYLSAIWVQITPYISVVWSSYGLEIFKWSGTVWNHFATEAFEIAGEDVVNDAFPNQVAAVILGVTAALKVRGRKAFAGFVETAAIGGVLLGGVVTELMDAAIIYVSHWHGSMGDVTPGTWSRATNTFRPFIGAIADAVLGSIRRRKPGVGV